MSSAGEDSDKDWVRCAAWLVQGQVLPRDHRSAQPTASQSDLAHTLRDGVLLCMMLNRLHPRAIDLKDFSQRPQLSNVYVVTVLAIFNSMFIGDLKHHYCCLV